LDNAPDYSGSSADYINEQSGSFLPDFGTVNFSDCILYWQGSGSGSGDFGAYNTIKVIMTSDGTSGGTLKSEPSAIGSDHASFSVTFYHP